MSFSVYSENVLEYLRRLSEGPTGASFSTKWTLTWPSKAFWWCLFCQYTSFLHLFLYMFKSVHSIVHLVSLKQKLASTSDRCCCCKSCLAFRTLHNSILLKLPRILTSRPLLPLSLFFSVLFRWASLVGKCVIVLIRSNVGYCWR